MDWDDLDWAIVFQIFRGDEAGAWKTFAGDIGISESVVRKRKAKIRRTKRFRELQRLVINTVVAYVDRVQN